MTSRGKGCSCKWAGVLLFCLVSFSAFVTAQDVNVVKSIRTVVAAAGSTSAPTIEVELNSSREFPIRDEVVILRIGTRDIFRSRTPSDGSLNTLIFMLTADEFAQIADGADMSVRYGKDLRGGRAAVRNPRWNFGKLNKALLAP